MRILALDIGGTAIKIGLLNEKGEILEEKEMPTLASEGGKFLMERILKVIESYENVDRIGISSAGQIDVESGSVIFATDNIPGWTGMEIKRRIEEKFSVPTAVENDVNAAAIGEAHFGAGKGQDSFLCLTYGTGIGGAIVENRDIYRGAYGSAGEFGHIITHGLGKKCTCGARGCYEAYASTSALVRSAILRLNLKTEINGRIIFEKALAGEKEYKEIVDDWLDEIVTGLISLVHIFNPSLIVLGGGVMQQDYVINYIGKKLPSCVMPSFSRVRVKGAVLGNRAGILGAFTLAMKLG